MNAEAQKRAPEAPAYPVIEVTLYREVKTLERANVELEMDPKIIDLEEALAAAEGTANDWHFVEHLASDDLYFDEVSRGRLCEVLNDPERVKRQDAIACAASFIKDCREAGLDPAEILAAAQ